VLFERGETKLNFDYLLSLAAAKVETISTYFQIGLKIFLKKFWPGEFLLLITAKIWNKWRFLGDNAAF